MHKFALIQLKEARTIFVWLFEPFYVGVTVYKVRLIMWISWAIRSSAFTTVMV